MVDFDDPVNDETRDFIFKLVPDLTKVYKVKFITILVVLSPWIEESLSAEKLQAIIFWVSNETDEIILSVS